VARQIKWFSACEYANSGEIGPHHTEGRFRDRGPSMQFDRIGSERRYRALGPAKVGTVR
jgi:hypothetical protein